MKFFIHSPLLILLCLLSSPAGAELKEIKLCSTHYPPWVVDKEGQAHDLEGISISSIRAIFKKAHIKNRIKFVNMPFKRCLSEAKDGSIDGIFFS
jgi:ABC-type amino acid transport substrate-binding protein